MPVGNPVGQNHNRSNINSYGNESLWHRQDSSHGFVPLGQCNLLALLIIFIQPILTSTFDMGGLTVDVDLASWMTHPAERDWQRITNPINHNPAR